jgi:hypothetical protein
MSPRYLQFLATIGTALYLVPTGTHLFELPHKMALSPAEYMTVQKIYVGWDLFGFVIGVTILTTLGQTLLLRADRMAFRLSLVAFLCLAAALAVFFAFTDPVNVATRFWSVAPEAFDAARRQWEYSHAASAMLTFAALVANVVSLLVHRTNTVG